MSFQREIQLRPDEQAKLVPFPELYAVKHKNQHHNPIRFQRYNRKLHRWEPVEWLEEEVVIVHKDDAGHVLFRAEGIACPEFGLYLIEYQPIHPGLPAVLDRIGRAIADAIEDKHTLFIMWEPQVSYMSSRRSKPLMF